MGLVLQALGGVFFVFAFSFQTVPYGLFGPGIFMGPWMMLGGSWMYGYFYYWFPVLAIVAGTETVLGALGVVWMNTTSLSRVRTGSVFVLVASIIAFPTMFGFMIGSLLMLTGSILGLTWQQRTS